MIVFCRVSSKDTINQFYIMATSFLAHHQDIEIYCLTDLDLKPIDSVNYVPYFYDIEQLGERFFQVSPFVCFMAPVNILLEFESQLTITPCKKDSVSSDVVVFSKATRDCEDSFESDLLNLTTPDYQDVGSIVERRTMANVALIVNTREFDPWVVQRNSYKTLIFPWERYFVALRRAEALLDRAFVNEVEANCQKHPHMLFYMMSGVFHV